MKILNGNIPDAYLTILKKIGVIGISFRPFSKKKLGFFYPNEVGDAVSELYKFQSLETYDVTIILPVYNMEQYIGRAVDALLVVETRFNIEVIIVNDGSTDSSVQIVTEMLKNRDVPDGMTFNVINQQNLGFSGARNTGIEQAKGKYLFFMDADDRIDSDTIDNLLTVAMGNDLDIVQGEAVRFNDAGEWPIVFSELSGYPWGKLFRRNLFKSIRFPENAWFEDSILMYLIFPNVTSYQLIVGGKYYYFQNDKGISASAKVSPKSVDTFYVMQSMYRMQRKLGIRQTQQRLKEYEHQIKLNSIRVEYLPASIRFALFKETQRFLQLYFEENPVLMDVQHTDAVNAILQNDFHKYNLVTLLA